MVFYLHDSVGPRRGCAASNHSDWMLMLSCSSGSSVVSGYETQGLACKVPACSRTLQGVPASWPTPCKCGLPRCRSSSFQLI